MNKVVDKLTDLKNKYEDLELTPDEEIVLIRANWVRIMELTKIKGVDVRSPEFKKIKKELEYRSWIMEEWAFANRIPLNYKHPVEGKVFNY